MKKTTKRAKKGLFKPLVYILLSVTFLFSLFVFSASAEGLTPDYENFQIYSQYYDLTAYQIASNYTSQPNGTTLSVPTLDFLYYDVNVGSVADITFSMYGWETNVAYAVVERASWQELYPDHYKALRFNANAVDVLGVPKFNTYQGEHIVTYNNVIYTDSLRDTSPYWVYQIENVDSGAQYYPDDAIVPKYPVYWIPCYYFMTIQKPSGQILQVTYSEFHRLQNNGLQDNGFYRWSAYIPTMPLINDRFNVDEGDLILNCTVVRQNVVYQTGLQSDVWRNYGGEVYYGYRDIPFSDDFYNKMQGAANRDYYVALYLLEDFPHDGIQFDENVYLMQDNYKDYWSQRMESFSGDFSLWLGNTVAGVFDAEFYPGFSFGALLFAIAGIGITFALIKIFAF